MISTSTFAFALALVAAAFAVAAWTTSFRLKAELKQWRSTTVNALASRLTVLDQRQKEISALAHEAKTGSPVKLAAEVAALADAVAKQADTHRRFAGKVWQRIGEKDSSSPNGAVDEDLAALLALQSAAPRAS